jgi:starch-binding outer membrane protein, SusD/RagB family
MKNLHKFFAIFLLAIFFSGCADEWLEEPKSYTLLLPDQVWNDPKMITSLLANYYNRLPVHSAIHSGMTNFAAYDEAIANGSNESSIDLSNNNLSNYAYSRWTLWDYGLIRDINKAIGGIAQYGTRLQPALKEQVTAEFRFLRAFVYFELVKRMGGVPIVTEELIYNFEGDPSYLAFPRNKEEEVYDFIATECDAIKNLVGNDGSKDRANKFSVLALKCRAMLYAGSISKYNNLMPAPISLPESVVGIPATRATGYYQVALDAAKEIITSGKYSLYDAIPDNKGQNFYEALVKKLNNTEMIMVVDFNVTRGKRHNFSYQNICRTMREDNLSSSGIGPSLNLVESFEYLDGTEGTLKGVGNGTVASQVNWIFYNNLSDIFANKDARLFGTVVYPGTSFKGVDVQMQAGVYEWDAAAGNYKRFESSTFGALHTDGKLLTGTGGPMRTTEEVSNTGFYIKKFIDPAVLSSARGVGSDIAWPRFRYGEVLLNAAEAAFELGGANVADALTYINAVRERAGFGPNSLDASTLTFDKIVNERKVELAFEDHRVWDLSRWRLAHILWDGQANNPDANMFALYPYRIVHPGSPNDGKYVFDKIKAPKFLTARYYRMGNYYSQIGQTVLDNNKLIVKNPFH